MSNMSTWLGPPHWNRKITRLARTLGRAAAAWLALGRSQQPGHRQAEQARAADAEQRAAGNSAHVDRKSLQAKCVMFTFLRVSNVRECSLAGMLDGVALGVGGDRELDVVALAFLLFVGDVFVGDVVRRAVGPQVLVDLIDGFERFRVLAGWRTPRAGSPWSRRCS